MRAADLNTRRDADLLEAARALAPEIEAARAEIDEQRRIPAPLFANLVDAGLFAILLPRSLGGAEASLATFAEVVEEIARADGSTAFCLAHAAGASTVAAFLPVETAREIFGQPGANMANGPGSARTAVAVNGGYRLTGRWAFASGCHHATWLGGGCVLVDGDGRPRLREDGSRGEYFLLFPARDAELVDIWQVNGLRGTGSDLISVTDLFVPADRAVPVPRRNPREPGPLYLFPAAAVYATGFAGVGLGIARGALDAFVSLASNKTPRGRHAALRENAVVQSQLAQAEALLRSARAFLYQAIEDAWEPVCRTGALPLEEAALLRLATTWAIQRAAQVVDTGYNGAGGTAVFTGDPLEQRFRDVHALTQQMQGRQDHFETVGQVLLGLEPDYQFL